jgi:hypothetical protein
MGPKKREIKRRLRVLEHAKNYLLCGESNIFLSASFPEEPFFLKLKSNARIIGITLLAFDDLCLYIDTTKPVLT